jgi:hypothetical protein
MILVVACHAMTSARLGAGWPVRFFQSYGALLPPVRSSPREYEMSCSCIHSYAAGGKVASYVSSSLSLPWAASRHCEQGYPTFVPAAHRHLQRQAEDLGLFELHGSNGDHAEST